MRLALQLLSAVEDRGDLRRAELGPGDEVARQARKCRRHSGYGNPDGGSADGASRGAGTAAAGGRTNRGAISSSGSGPRVARAARPARTSALISPPTRIAMLAKYAH